AGPRGGRTSAGGYAPTMNMPQGFPGGAAAPPPAGFPPPQAPAFNAPPPQQQDAPAPQQAYVAPPTPQYVAPPTQQYAPPPQADYSQMPSAPPVSSAEVEVMDGTRAMEVQTVYRDVVIGTRHLYNPTGQSTHGKGTAMMYAGIGLVLIGLITFVAT